MSMNKFFSKLGIGPVGGFHIMSWILILIFLVTFKAWDFTWDMLYDPEASGYQTKVTATVVGVIALMGGYMAYIIGVFKNKK